MVRVRIAPSPTGMAHVGTAYVSLFNLAFARKNGGKFILRIEDTDKKREVEGGIDVIKEGLSWLGLTWDEFYRQSERLSIYKEYAEKLLKEGKAYEEDGGIILKVEKEDVSWKDLVRGEITFPADEVSDFAIIKKDGFPTYNFAVVVDDWQMKVTHVIRAEDHISNTPRQIAAYKALGANIPEFAHVPLLRNKDKSKISKRKNPVALSWYKEEGYLPEALVNFLCLLGWSHPEEKEVFDMDEFVKNFDLERVRKAGPVFDMDKLDWMNGEYIKSMDDKKLADTLAAFYKERYEKDLLTKTAPLVKERIRKLSEYESLASFYYEQPKIDKELFGKDYKDHLESAVEVLESVGKWEANNLGEVLVGVADKKGFHRGDFFMNLRVAVTGKKVTPPFNESVEILGKEETIKRLKTVL